MTSFNISLNTLDVLAFWILDYFVRSLVDNKNIVSQYFIHDEDNNDCLAQQTFDDADNGNFFILKMNSTKKFI